MEPSQRESMHKGIVWGGIVSPLSLNASGMGTYTDIDVPASLGASPGITVAMGINNRDGFAPF
jgi:hypothetical protein